MRNNNFKLLILVCMLIFISLGWSVVADYTFTSATGTYSEISGGTIHGTSTNNEEVFNAVPIGFDFIYNAQPYTAVSISCNGFIAMGSTVTTSNTPLSTGATNNVVAAMTRDLISRSDGSLKSLLSGTAPNRIFTIQWKNYRRNTGTAANDTLNFQIQLHETSNGYQNVIKFAYGYFKAANSGTAANVQCGLRGAANTDFNNRTTTTSWTATTLGLVNTATCTMNNTIVPPNGLVFNWVVSADPPPPPQLISPVNNSTFIGQSALLHWVSDGGAPTGYKVYFGTNNPPTNIANGTITTALSYDPNPDLSFNTVYFWKVIAFNPSGDGLSSPVWSFTTMPVDTVYTFPYSQTWDSVTAPNVYPAWTVINANNDAYTWATSTTGYSSAPNTVRCTASATLPMDDWLVSPPLQLVAGTFYQFEFKCKAHNVNFPEKLEMKIGTAKTVEAMTTQIYNNVNLVNTGYLVEYAYFVPATSGTYYAGFHGYSNANTYFIYLDDLSITSIIPVFNPPQNLTAATGNGTVILNWQTPADRRLSGYNIYRDGVLLNPTLISATTYIDNTAIIGTSYEYYAVAVYVNPTGVSTHSNTVTMTPVFNPPVSFQATGGINIVNMSWTAPTGIAPNGYKVYRDAISLTPTPITALIYTDNTGTPGQTYAYNATAIYASGESLPSNTINTGPVPPVNPPADLTATVVSPNVILNWATPPARPASDKIRQNHLTRDLLGFRVYRNSVLISAINDAEVLTYTDRNLMPNTYNYTVSALYTVGESIQTEPVPATVLPVFNPPLNLVATDGLTTISVRWSPPSPILGNLSGYRLFRDGAALGHGLIADTLYNDSAIVSGTVYTYFAKAVYNNPAGESVPSNSDTATGGEPLNPVYNLQSSVDQDNVSLTWTPPGGPILQDWIHYDNTLNSHFIGNNGVVNFDIAARFTQTELDGISDRYLTKVRFFPGSASCIYTVKIYTGGTSLTNPGFLADTVLVQNPVINAWNVVTLHAPIPIPAAGDLRIAVNCNATAGNPAGSDDGPSNPYKGNVIFINNEWTILTLITNPPLDYNWNIEGFVVNFIGRDDPIILSNSIEPVRHQIPTSTPLTAIVSPRSMKEESAKDDTRPLTGYIVYRNGLPIATIPEITTSHYTDSGLPNGTYTYTVTALYTNGESAPCAPINVTVNVTVIPIAINEGFETYDNFALTFGNWMLRDLDNSPTTGIQNVTFPNSGSPIAFMVFNPSATTPPMTTLTPHTGQKIAASFAANTPPNNDYLMTQRMRLGTENSISLWVKSFSDQYGLERFKVGLSENEDPTPITFTWLSGPNYIEASTEWTIYTYQVPTSFNAHIVRFGIKCESNDAFIFMVDDVIVRGYNINLTDNDDEVVPVSATGLLGNYPNPFNPQTEISYDMKNDEQVSIEIFNVKGEKIKTLVNTKVKAGNHKVTWLGDDEYGKNVTSGVYFYRMKSGKYSASKKMILLK